jgi:hypothetical protein
LRCHLLRRSMSFCAMAEDMVSSLADTQAIMQVMSS